MGPTGADAIAPGSHVAVVVDVLSFTTTLTVALSEHGWSDTSPEAQAAAASFAAIENDVGAALRACASGRELVDIGYANDVDTAAQLDESHVVPVLDGDAFIPA